jgi:hypothetical protein
MSVTMKRSGAMIPQMSRDICPVLLAGISFPAYITDPGFILCFLKLFDKTHLSSGFFERDQPVDPFYIIFIFLAKSFRKLFLFCSDENHDANVQKDRSNKIRPG